MSLARKDSLATHFHFIGIGGIGMSALAKLLLKQNYPVSGSDRAASAMTKTLETLGAKIQVGHSEHHIESGMRVIFSSDIKDDNPEMQAARKKGCTIWHRSDLLTYMMEDKKGLAVAGTHGKTTTTSLLASLLIHAELDPSFMVGGIVQALQSNAEQGCGEFFVVEADESDGTFLKYSPYGAIVTNIDKDHMNFFKTETALIKAFEEFISKIQHPEHFFWWGDDPYLSKLSLPGNRYGFGKECEWRIEGFRQEEWKTIFDLTHAGQRYPAVEVNLTGQHNVLNATAVFALSSSLGIPETVIREVFANFQGVKRRCEKRGEVNGVLLLDDYAHHPTEIATTLRAIKSAIGQRRLWAVFQPHRYSRMQHCIGCFEGVFEKADSVIITDLYTSGESPIEGVNTETIVQDIQQHFPDAQHLPRQQIADLLKERLTPGDVVVSLGAGDITRLAHELQTVLTERFNQDHVYV